MEFLYKLYSNNYFGIGLFIVITVLAFAFLIILFFGKKDEKIRIAKEIEKQKVYEEENKNDQELKEVEAETLEPLTLSEEVSLENINRSEFSKESTVEKTNSLENPILETADEYSKLQKEMEIFEEPKREEMDPFVTSNIVLNTDYITDEPSKDLEIVSEKENYSQNANVYSMNSVRNEEAIEENNEETIDDVLNKYEAIEETIFDQPNREEMEIQNENNRFSDPYEEQEVDIFSKSSETIKKTTSSPFSSVYLTKEEADAKVEEKATISPMHSTFEMPKRVDLPKRSENASTINENIISSLREERNEGITQNVFDNLEEDSYTIQK